MTDSVKVIILLIHKAIDKDCCINLQDLKNVDWDDVIKLAFANGVGPIALTGAQQLPLEYKPEKKIMLRWIGQTLVQANKFQQQKKVANKLADWWFEKGISATVIKGRSIAQYYPVPEHRYSCDLDVFIEDGWTEACDILVSKGIRLGLEVYKEVEFSLDGVYVECHRFITPLRGNKNLLEFEKYLRQLLRSDEKEYFEDGKLMRPSLMFNSMLFVEHALGDFLHGELTMKHIVDWMVLRKQGIKWETFFEKCDEFKFNKFLPLLNTLSDVVEGKAKYEELTSDYRNAFDELLRLPKSNTKRKTWFQRRVELFFEIIENRKKYNTFGYCSMESFLFNSMWTHFFDKELRVK